MKLKTPSIIPFSISFPVIVDHQNLSFETKLVFSFFFELVDPELELELVLGLDGALLT